MSKTKQKYCEWCSKKTNNEPSQVSLTPILEEIEQEINSYGDRDKLWGVDSDWSTLNLSSTFEAKLMVYDDMLNQIKLRTICPSCIEQDDILYEKYYGDEIIFTLDFDMPDDLN
tara:strand:- start:989 stop:1330 length:342 start_codon:yes stop_codon:yes gene_type:complete